MKAVDSSVTLVSIYQTTQRDIPEDSHLQAKFNQDLVICQVINMEKQTQPFQFVGFSGYRVTKT